jgi:hypothetical protein
MNRSIALLASVAATLCLSSTAFAAGADTVIVKTTFDSDLGGWTTNTAPDVSWSAKGGNPGGEALFNDVTSGVGTFIYAPSTFLSPAINFTKLDGKAYISFQHRMVKETGANSTGNYNIVISGPGGTATFAGGLSIVQAKKNPWMTVVAPLVEADWVMSGGTWAALMANVTSIQVPMEMVSNDPSTTDEEAIDNIEIVSMPKGFSPK